MVAHIGSGAAEVIVTDRKGEFTKDAAVGLRRERLIGAEMEAHPTVAAKQEGASHSLVGYNVHPDGEGRGRGAVVTELDGHASLLVSAEQLLGSETAPRFRRGGSDARRVSGACGDHLVEGSSMDE